MNIVTMEVTNEIVLRLFSEHDDYMIDFLGKDKWCYTRYSENENIEIVWVIYTGNLPIGCMSFRKKSDGIGELKRLYIQSDYRGNGISKKLLETAELYAKKQGCNTLFLDTRITLEPAVSIYQSFGFHIVYQQDLYIQMEKDI